MSSPPQDRVWNGFTVDVEDYFHAESLASCVDRSTWGAQESRVVGNTHRVLDLLAKHNVHGTFFVLGWVASRFPALVRDIHAAGHELACHSYWHRLIYQLTQEEMRSDTRQAKDAIEQCIGTAIIGYRAPTFSITKQSWWALDILAELGFAYDSSIYPIHHDRYGVPDSPRFPHVLHTACGDLREFPLSTLSLLGNHMPFGGGGYLRLLPMSYNRIGFHWLNRREHQPVILYVHPWEIDPDQPRLAVKPLVRLRHYGNLARVSARLEALLSRYSFVPLRELLRESQGV